MFSGADGYDDETHPGGDAHPKEQPGLVMPFQVSFGTRQPTVVRELVVVASKTYENRDLLSQLRISTDHLESLSRQGFVSEERSHSGRSSIQAAVSPSTAEQVVRYVGSDPAVARELREELVRRQAFHRSRARTRMSHARGASSLCERRSLS